MTQLFVFSISTRPTMTGGESPPRVRPCFPPGYAKNRLRPIFFTLPATSDSPPDCQTAKWAWLRSVLCKGRFALQETRAPSLGRTLGPLQVLDGQHECLCGVRYEQKQEKKTGRESTHPSVYGQSGMFGASSAVASETSPSFGACFFPSQQALSH